MCVCVRACVREFPCARTSVYGKGWVVGGDWGVGWGGDIERFPITDAALHASGIGGVALRDAVQPHRVLRVWSGTFH